MRTRLLPVQAVNGNASNFSSTLHPSLLAPRLHASLLQPTLYSLLFEQMYGGELKWLASILQVTKTRIELLSEQRREPYDRTGLGRIRGWRVTCAPQLIGRVVNRSIAENVWDQYGMIRRCGEWLRS
jgi:hypothetical protein